MNNIFNTNKPVAHVGRNGFDGSFSRTFVMRPGVARGVCFEHTVPNSSYKINCADIVRTSALQTAAFLRGKQELDFFFVPYSQIYSRSNDVILSRGDEHSAAFAELSGGSFPLYPLCSLIEHAAMPYFAMRFARFYYDRIYSYFKSELNPPLLYFEPYYCMTNFISSIYNEIFGVVTDKFDELMFYYDYPGEMPRPLGSDDFEHVFSNYLTKINNSSFIGADAIQFLSTAGYGDYYLQIKSLFDQAISSFDNAMASRSDPSIIEESDIRGAITDMAHTLGENFFNQFLFHIDSVYNPVDGESSRLVNLLNLMAYQKVWRDVYRDLVNDISQLYLYASNMDYDISSCFLPFGRQSDHNLRPILTFLRPRLRMLRKDLSTGLYTSSQFGTFAKTADAAGMPGGSTEIGSSNSASAVSIKYTLALQRYRQTLLRAGTRTKDLLMSEFGVKSRYIEDTYVHHIGSFDGALDVNRVNATAESGTYSPGDIAGNVFSSLQGNTIEFTCNDHGVIVGVISFLSDPLHNAFGIDPFIIKHVNMDFYHEAFDNLGLQPVSSQLFSMLIPDGHGTISNSPITLGFSARYNEYKQHIDTVHDTFCTTNFVPYSGNGGDQYILSPSGVNSNYVCVRDIMQTLSQLKLRSYQLPSSMDTVFKNIDTGDPENAHFDIALQVNMSKVLPMSVLGLI